MSRKQVLVSATLMVTVIMFLSKISGFIRETVIAAYYGTSMEADAFQIAFSIPSIIFDSIALAIILSFTPVFIEILTNRGEQEANNFVKELNGLTLIVTLIIAVVSTSLAPIIVRIVAPGFNGAALMLTVQLTQIVLPLVIFRLLSGIASGYLNSRQAFFFPAIIGIVMNIFIIGATVLFSKSYGVRASSIGVLIGVMAMLFVQLPRAYQLGMTFTLKPNFHNPYIKKLIILAIPVFLSSALQQVSTLIDRMMASSLPTGAIASLTYAQRLNGFVLGIFVSSLATVFYPQLSSLVAENRLDEFRTSFNTALKTIALFVLPMMVGLIVLSTPIVQILFERGAFNATATSKTSIALVMFAFGLIGFSFREILNRVFYALKDTKTPTINAVIAIVVNIVLNIILIKPMAHAGLALGTSVAATVMTVLLFVSLRKKLGYIGGKSLVIGFSKMGLAALVMGCCTYAFNQLPISFAAGRLGEVIKLALNISLSGCIYFLVALLLGVEEVKTAIDLVVRKIKSKRATVSVTS